MNGGNCYSSEDDAVTARSLLRAYGVDEVRSLNSTLDLTFSDARYHYSVKGWSSITRVQS